VGCATADAVVEGPAAAADDDVVPLGALVGSMKAGAVSGADAAGV